MDLDPSDFRYHMGCWVSRREECGCILAICSDDHPDAVLDFLTEERAAGREPEHMKFRDASAEDGFFNCEHRS